MEKQSRNVVGQGSSRLCLEQNIAKLRLSRLSRDPLSLVKRKSTKDSFQARSLRQPESKQFHGSS